MSNRPEPDDVHLCVGGVELDTRSSIETARIIEELKKRPGYPLEAEEAKRILAALGIDAPNYGIPDPKSFLEHWQGCVAALRKADLAGPNGAGVDTENIGVSSGPARESPT